MVIEREQEAGRFPPGVHQHQEVVVDEQRPVRRPPAG
jgi:hypothetical protein